MFGCNKNQSSMCVVIVAGFFSIITASITNPQGFEYVKNEIKKLSKLVKNSQENWFSTSIDSNKMSSFSPPNLFFKPFLEEGSAFETDASGTIHIVLPEELDTSPR